MNAGLPEGTSAGEPGEHGSCRIIEEKGGVYFVPSGVEDSVERYSTSLGTSKA